jgi:hypothetical protein
MIPPTRRVVYAETVPIEMRVDGLDLGRLRRGFAELFDRAVQAVQLAGYEQDDAVLERFLIVRSAGGEEVVVRADWLADRERLVDHVASELERAIDGTWKPSDVKLIKIKVVAVLESGR